MRTFSWRAHVGLMAMHDNLGDDTLCYTEGPDQDMRRITIAAVTFALVAGLTVAGAYASSSEPAPRAVDLPRIVTSLPASRDTTLSPTSPVKPPATVASPAGPAAVHGGKTVTPSKPKPSHATASAPAKPSANTQHPMSGRVDPAQSGKRDKTPTDDHEVVHDQTHERGHGSSDSSND